MTSTPNGPDDPWAPQPGGTPPSGSDPAGPPSYGQPYGQNPSGPPAYGQQPYGQQPYGQQPYGYPTAPGGSPYGPPQTGWNGFAIAGFVCAFLCSILGIIFSAIALNQIGKSGQRGKSLATWGLGLSIVFLVVAIVVDVARS
jgi:hypothetical protein